MPVSVDPASLLDAYSRACDRLERQQFARVLWGRRPESWSNDPRVQATIASRLGWLHALDVVTPQLGRLTAFADTVRADGFTDVVLLGMGGSSLAPEVMRQVLGVADGYPRFRMLDSVDPDAVRQALEQAATSLFVVASKSGSTIEPNVMAAEAVRRVLAAGHTTHGSRFIAITDEGTALHHRAINERFREVFVNPTDIGGRYSALSFVGLVPAALMGVDLEGFIQRARTMEEACRRPGVTANPALALGALMAAGALAGRDKLTLLLPDRLASLGLWVEQLVAESTGKRGSGVVPITGEPASASLGTDRVAVVVTLGTEGIAAERRQRLAAAALPTVTLDIPDVLSLGAEFMRWEVATAAAGALMAINPFDEPNVQQAKDATRALLDVYTRVRRLPTPEATASLAGVTLAVSRAATNASPGESALAFLRQILPGDYFGLLAYLPPDDHGLARALRGLRESVSTACRCATTFGYGPRYLHSTGQLHKGGANNGVFIVITADAASDLEIPDQVFSFGVLELAQALGDFQSLDQTGRRALYVHLPRREPPLLAALTEALIAGL